VRAFVDCGRLSAASPALALARRAALTILLCRPNIDEINALVPAVAELSPVGCTLGLVCVGHQPYQPAEVAASAGLPLLGVLPVDHRAAAEFDRNGIDSGRAFRRSALAQTAAELTEVVRARCASVLSPVQYRSPSPAPSAATSPRWQEPTRPASQADDGPVSPAIAAARAGARSQRDGDGPAPTPPDRPSRAGETP
jgi:hypothetical protein